MSSSDKEPTRYDRILLVSPLPSFRTAVEQILTKAGHQITAIWSFEEAVRALEEVVPHVIITDLHLAGGKENEGLELLKMIRAHHPDMQVILHGTGTSVDTVIEAMKLGANDFMVEPINLVDVVIAVERAIYRVTDAARPKRTVGTVARKSRKNQRI